MSNFKETFKKIGIFTLGGILAATIAVGMYDPNVQNYINNLKSGYEVNVPTEKYDYTFNDKIEKLETYEWDETPETFKKAADKRTNYIMVFKKDSKLYVAGFNNKNDIKFKWFGLSDELENFEPAWCRAA